MKDFKRKKSTDELMKILKNKSSYSDYISENKGSMDSNKTLPQMLEKLLNENHITKSKAIKNSQLESHYAYQIFNGTKTPSRDKLIMLCIGCGATVEQTRKMLIKIKAAPLYPKDKRDSIILFGILHKIPVMDIDILLYEHGLPTLIK